ncbi:hypothetical protein J6590_002327 [Homalodisca vitripennis]|nr:hypothetical protein J6590_002327 [Homalodisca vitripennis]
MVKSDQEFPFLSGQYKKTDESFKCDKCGKVYTVYSSFWSHRKYYCGKEPSFRCPFCGYCTWQKSNFRVHLKMKHPDQEYSMKF